MYFVQYQSGWEQTYGAEKANGSRSPPKSLAISLDPAFDPILLTPVVLSGSTPFCKIKRLCRWRYEEEENSAKNRPYKTVFLSGK